MLKKLLLAFLFLVSYSLDAQVTGLVTDKENNPLPYVNVYYQGSTIGTTTNLDGEFNLPSQSEKDLVVFQFIGFKKKTISLKNLDLSSSLTVIMEVENYSLDQVEIIADAEDPAYAIIRKAQEKRKYYLSKQQNYSCNVYVKGFNEIVSSPKKLLGKEIGDLEGNLDEDGTGVVYLSESISTVYKKGADKKEIMHSSKVSGNDQIYSFNSAKEMDFNFYLNTVEINRDMVSPIARNAMAHYKYKLEGAYYKGDQLVNKIKVIPKNPYGNTFNGYIYINEDLWNIQSLDLSATKHSLALPFIDTLICTQNFVPVEGDNWMLFSNVILFEASVVGFKIQGNFGGVFTDYQLGKVTDDDFGNEVFKVTKEANTRSERYWDTIRPIPLTKAEKIDYHRKDSIRIIRESPAYLDSLDSAANKFKITNILTGYSYQNSRKKSSFSFTSPLNKLGTNTLQGWNSTFSVEHNKYFNKVETKRLTQQYSVNYGLSDKVFRGEFDLTYRANRTNNARIILKGGKALTQYSRLNPISLAINSIFTFFFRRNYLKAYDKEFISLRYSSQLINGVYGNTSLEYENRTAFQNQFFGGLQQDNRDFTSNNPQNPNDDALAFAPHKALIFRVHLIINPGQKTWNYPDRIFRENSNWPTLGIYYKKGIDVGSNSSTFDLLYASLSKEIEMGIHGNSSLFLQGGTFLGAAPEQFIDRMHFTGTQTHLADASSYYRRFLMLPYYDMSTASDHIQGHYQHNFKGFLMSKIPLLKKTEWHLVGGYKYLSTADQGSYDEITVGLDNFGFKLFRLFRIDAVFHKRYSSDAYPVSKARKVGFIVGFAAEL